jgi:WD40 repeat protein
MVDYSRRAQEIVKIEWHSLKYGIRGTLTKTMEMTKVNPIFYLCFSPTGRQLAAKGAWEITIWDLQTQQPSFIFECATESRNCPCSFSSDGNALVASSVKMEFDDGVFSSSDDESDNDDLICVWNLTTGTTAHELFLENSSITVIAASPTDSRFAFGDHRTPMTRIFDFSTGSQDYALPGSSSVNAISYSFDGQNIVVCAEDKSLSIWETVNWTISYRTVLEVNFRNIQFDKDSSKIIGCINPAEHSRNGGQCAGIFDYAAEAITHLLKMSAKSVCCTNVTTILL